ncbi:12251_t:CDS:2, partial [Cetraspora pellucida]
MPLVKDAFTKVINNIEHFSEIIGMKIKNNNKKIRCAAAGHTWSSLSIQYNKKLKTWTVTTEAGVYLKDIDDKLRKHNPPITYDSSLVLNTVTTSGIISTDVSEKVISFQIVTSDGELHEFSDEIDPVEMSAARISLGKICEHVPGIIPHMRNIIGNRLDEFEK